MKPFTLGEIAAACGGRFVGTEEQKQICITSVERDSRQIQNGSLFLAIKGARADGHDFIDKCYQQGAVCALCEQAPKSTDKAYILVPSTLDAVKQIAKAYRRKFDIPVIGVSGSVGKTSTKEMLYAVLSQKYRTHKTQGNLNNELGVPLTLLAMPEDAEAAVIEMGISDFGEMSRLSEMVQPTVCVLTVIGCCHLENLIDRDGVLKAKTEMFLHAADNAVCILNGDDDKLSTVTAVRGRSPVFYGLSDTHRFYAEQIENNAEDGIRCTLCFDGKRLPVTIPAIGTYMVSNALAGVAVGVTLGLSDEQLKNGVEAYQTVGSRARVVNTSRIRIIDDCYNANPTSVQASLDTLMNFTGRKVAVLGDMKELGADEATLHFDTGRYAKERGVDLVLAVGLLAAELAKGADGQWFADNEQLLAALPSLIHDGDTVLVKASHSMQFEQITQRLTEMFR
ncbi:MAG: UDP-N-acetylmuramoyl-tripeptide--D-alanyl-D-alanine ligase [Ruminococcaceae bacterium]|nr:UDP-N-acetylmuramoyl-tripeptide--D-alanyl-D-alanine ligase [Oscillospiraceae bacterium]